MGSSWNEILRQGFGEMAEVGATLSAGHQNTPSALRDRLDVISSMMAEGKRVMIHFRVTGTNNKRLHGIPALGKSADAWEIAFAEFDGSEWKYMSFAFSSALLKRVKLKNTRFHVPRHAVQLVHCYAVSLYGL